ncbi:MFS transporter [Actinoplanes sp. N902-109]|uniref:MFS transporter n=1 Tax=Actinoplanes sp. (strain N902-109) TaxID=649831 RepID=UPI000329620D|nr:MFS transporter [Actinoplanes sp. N902-109]AGL18752.1 hypothetical protein L083_5242 [Actinoplanes sp. N902-109]
MARTKMKERPTARVDVEMGATGGRKPPSKLAVTLLGVCILAVIWAAMMMIPAGRVAYVYIFSYSEFYMGVLTLVSLSITIMVGLVSTDRLVLTIRQRLLLQSTHRTTGVMAIAALGIHLWTKYAMGKMQFIDAFIPFLNPGKTLFIGFGTISGWVMVLVMWTGIARARFIGRGKPWMWRGIHSISYLIWPIALLHGLNAGRPAAVWVIVSYVVCVLMVLIGLAVRIAVSLNRKKDFASQQGTAGGNTGGMKPVGKLASAGTAGKGRGRSRREEDPFVSDRGNAVQAWKPAAPRPAGATGEQPAVPAAAPVSPAPMPVPVAERAERRPRPDEDERARRRRDFADVPTQRWEFEDEDDMPARRQRRYEDDAPAPRQRRGERFDEPTGSFSRRALTEGYADEEEDVAPAPRASRRADDGYDDAPRRPRRYAEDEAADEPAPRPRARRLADEDAAMPAPPRSRRAAFAPDFADDADDMPAPRSRRAVYEEDAPAPRSRRTGYDEDDAPAPRSRRAAYDEEEVPRPRRYADDDRYDDAPRRRAPRASRYAEEDEEAPRARRDRGADVDRADSGRHSRSEFVEPAADHDGPGSYGPGYDRPGYDRPDYDGPDYDGPDDIEPDETPTLVDMAQRRARRAAQLEQAGQQESARTGTGRGARRGSRTGTVEEADDAGYWATLRGEAQ